MLSAAGCAGRNGPVSCEPAIGIPFHDSYPRLVEYQALYRAGASPAIRAWIREADKVIRANNAYSDHPQDPNEDDQ